MLAQSREAAVAELLDVLDFRVLPPPLLAPRVVSAHERVFAPDDVDDFALTVLDLGPGTDDQTVLAAALGTGRVTHFAWQQPTLVELFREAVAPPAPVEVAA